MRHNGINRRDVYLGLAVGLIGLILSVTIAAFSLGLFDPEARASGELGGVTLGTLGTSGTGVALGSWDRSGPRGSLRERPVGATALDGGVSRGRSTVDEVINGVGDSDSLLGVLPGELEPSPLGVSHPKLPSGLLGHGTGVEDVTREVEVLPVLDGGSQPAESVLPE